MTPDIILQRTGIDVRAVEQGDDAWHKLRLGVITASEVHNVIAKPRPGKKWPELKMSYFHTLLAEARTGVVPEVNAKALAWGKHDENAARARFEFPSGVNVDQ
ncbi:YqaJ viral recombinase family protein [Escherichia coli]|nr:YqaJ viral recombinase family protein [Escherichia coli]